MLPMNLTVRAKWSLVNIGSWSFDKEKSKIAVDVKDVSQVRLGRLKNREQVKIPVFLNCFSVE